MKKNLFHTLLLSLLALLPQACSEGYFKNDYENNSPTSGKLKLYYDEGLQRHIQSHTYVFHSQYPNARVEAYPLSENEAVELLFKDSCKAILISRQLSETETKAFESKSLFPKFSAVAKSGIAFVTNVRTPVDSLSQEQVMELLTRPFVCKDSISNNTRISLLLDRKNSSLTHYLVDSLLKGQKLSETSSVLGSSAEAINYVAGHKNVIAVLDFAWLSDSDDSLYKANKGKLKFISIEKNGKYAYPGQSSFKLGTYPFTRTIYYIRRSSEFSLAKGFESFMAGPQGQMLFLKQGLLPQRQQERNIEVNYEPVNTR